MNTTTEPVRPQESDVSQETEAIIRERLATLDRDKKTLSTPQEVFRRILHPAP